MHVADDAARRCLTRVSRRDALRMLSCGFPMVAAVRRDGSHHPAAVAHAAARSQSSGVNRSKIIRTVLKDMPVESFPDGTTLFHEHMSLDNAFFARMRAKPGETIDEKAAAQSPYWMDDLDVMVK